MVRDPRIIAPLKLSRGSGGVTRMTLKVSRDPLPGLFAKIQGPKALRDG